MAGRGRNHSANNGPRGSHRGPPNPGLMHPVPGPFLPNMLPPHLAPHPGLAPMFIEQKLASQQAEMQRLLNENMPPHLGPHSGLPPMLIEQKLATQHAEIQRLLSENQRLAATHVSLRQEIVTMQQELQRIQANTPLETEKDEQIRALSEKVSRMDVDLRAMDSLKGDLEKLLSQRQELSAQLQFYTQESQRTKVDTHQIAALKTEVDSLHQELQHARLVCEQERKASIEHLEQRQAMERNVFSMVREVEKLRAELASAENRAQGVFASGTSSASAAYNGLPVKSYENGYPIQQTQSLGSWGGAYDSQQIITSHEPVSRINGQVGHAENNLVTDAAKYSLGSDNSHMSQRISQDHSSKLSNDTKVVGEWSVHMAPNGKSFYYNSLTGVTQWDKPTSMATFEAQSLTQSQEEKRQVLESLLSHINTAQQQSSVAGMNQSMQMQAQQPAFLEQHALGQMQGLHSGYAQIQNSSMQVQGLAQAQSPTLMQLQAMQQPAAAQTQSAWLAQSPSGQHAHYSSHPSQSQVQQHLGQASYVGLPGESATAGVDAEAAVSAAPLMHSRPQVSEVSLNGMRESMSTGNPVSGTTRGPQGANLFVFGIPDDFNDRKLAELFSAYGRVLYAKVGVERDTGRGKGYGFISMDSPQAAEAAIGAVDGMHISGKCVRVELKRGDHDVHSQQHSQQEILNAVGPTRWHSGSELMSHRPY